MGLKLFILLFALLFANSIMGQDSLENELKKCFDRIFSYQEDYRSTNTKIESFYNDLSRTKEKLEDYGLDLNIGSHQKTLVKSITENANSILIKLDSVMGWKDIRGDYNILLSQISQFRLAVMEASINDVIDDTRTELNKLVRETDSSLKKLITDAQTTIKQSESRIKSNTDTANQINRDRIDKIDSLLNDFTNMGMGVGFNTEQSLNFTFFCDRLFDSRLSVQAFFQGKTNETKFGMGLNLGYRFTNFGILPLGIDYIIGESKPGYSASIFIKQNGIILTPQYSTQFGYGVSILFSIREKILDK